MVLNTPQSPFPEKLPVSENLDDDNFHQFHCNFKKQFKVLYFQKVYFLEQIANFCFLLLNSLFA